MDGVAKDVIKERYGSVKRMNWASRHLPVKEAELAGKENDATKTQVNQR
ncbi:hypothetical protein ACT691_04175 [Vibrio metschnikovii]